MKKHFAFLLVILLVVSLSLTACSGDESAEIIGNLETQIEDLQAELDKVKEENSEKDKEIEGLKNSNSEKVDQIFEMQPERSAYLNHIFTSPFHPSSQDFFLVYMALFKSMGYPGYR